MESSNGLFDFSFIDALLMDFVSGSGEIESIDMGFKSVMEVLFGGVTDVDLLWVICCSVLGVEYKWDWFLVAPRNLNSSSLSIEEMMETCEADLVTLFLRDTGWSSSSSDIRIILGLVPFIIVGWIFSSMAAGNLRLGFIVP